MKSLEINVDLDGIITDFDGAVKTAYARQTGEIIDLHRRQGFGLYRLVKWPELIDNLIGKPGFFLNLVPMPGAIETLAGWHRMGHDINILTAPARQYLNSASEKFEWCKKHLPFLKTDNITVTNKKYRVRGDVFIDDSPTQLVKYAKTHPQATTMTIAYSYNRECKVGVRAQSWCEPAAAWQEFDSAVLKLSNESKSSKPCVSASPTKRADRTNMDQGTRPWCPAFPERMMQLVGLFPLLRDHMRDGRLLEHGWDAGKFDKWATGPAPGSGAMAAACFVLSVWNPSMKWKCGPFNLHRALSCWDEVHRDAFLSWAKRPWWA